MATPVFCTQDNEFASAGQIIEVHDGRAQAMLEAKTARALTAKERETWGRFDGHARIDKGLVQRQAKQVQGGMKPTMDGYPQPA
jgi:hypothetical protein